MGSVKFVKKSVGRFKNEYGDTYVSFSGHDMICVAGMPLRYQGSHVKVLGSLQTITYSIHDEKTPVRALGDMNPKGYIFGPRTIAGSMIFTVFDRHWMTEFMEDYAGSIQKWDSHSLSDELPPLNLTISMTNEYGHTSYLALYGVTFVNEGQVMSINDIYTENTYQFYAMDIDYLTNLDLKTDNEERDLPTERTDSVYIDKRLVNPPDIDPRLQEQQHLDDIDSLNKNFGAKIDDLLSQDLSEDGLQRKLYELTEERDKQFEALKRKNYPSSTLDSEQLEYSDKKRDLDFKYFYDQNDLSAKYTDGVLSNEDYRQKLDDLRVKYENSRQELNSRYPDFASALQTAQRTKSSQDTIQAVKDKLKSSPYTEQKKSIWEQRETAYKNAVKNAPPFAVKHETALKEYGFDIAEWREKMKSVTDKEQSWLAEQLKDDSNTAYKLVYNYDTGEMIPSLFYDHQPAQRMRAYVGYKS